MKGRWLATSKGQIERSSPLTLTLSRRERGLSSTMKRPRYRTGQVCSGWLVVLDYRRPARPDLLTGPSTRRSSRGWFSAVAVIAQISIGFPTGAKCQVDEGFLAVASLMHNS